MSKSLSLFVRSRDSPYCVSSPTSTSVKVSMIHCCMSGFTRSGFVNNHLCFTSSSIVSISSSSSSSSSFSPSSTFFTPSSPSSPSSFRFRFFFSILFGLVSFTRPLFKLANCKSASINAKALPFSTASKVWSPSEIAQFGSVT